MSTDPRPSYPRVLWDAWKAYAERAAGYQSAALLSLIYFLVLGPAVLIARATGKAFLDLDRRPRTTYWITRPPADRSLRAMERQF